MALAGTITDLH